MMYVHNNKLFSNLIFFKNWVLLLLLLVLEGDYQKWVVVASYSS